jgi:hypothetical protein
MYLCSLGNSMLGELTGKDEADGGLNLAGRDGRLLVVSRKLGRLGRDALEDVWKKKTPISFFCSSQNGSRLESHTVDEGVQDRHGTVRDTGVRVDLLEHLVDVGGVGLLSSLGALLFLAGGSGLLRVLEFELGNEINF